MRSLNHEQIKAFLAVVRLGGVHRATQILNLTQPAITARIKKLEETLGIDLFERTPSGLRLTRHGEMMVPYAEQFERLHDRVESQVIPREGIDSTLRLGASETIVQCWLPDLVAELHTAYPRLQVEINIDISVNLRAALLDREIDLAILLGPISEYSVDNIELPSFDLAWYVAGGVTPSTGRDADLLREKPVITYARNTRPYRELKGLLLEQVGPDVPVFPSSSLLACFRLVEAGLGVAALPKALGYASEAMGKIREFDPGWRPSSLRFTASYLGDPRRHLIETASKLVRTVAERWRHDRNV
ncbi:LysR family transcriptional regulator [Brucella anthropi]|uniref:LysR family transcriptional regulator n=1 Tax=Brucella anthropi TaxID=529 RepID=UPI00244AD192|nr:LysR family transcriptional regulator [Brucella anthropi]MDG9793551.1 LysR family transcriptional regulator [Brucella anthropi]MDH0583382.1 LysR family transcriptional regulator [Brucella anthropi]MDH0819951.1 LysR family transcriptional regulator [Brucella anthropi]MDH2086776.1 LysR family transcriptional regulator [Brucella anthropi]